MARYRILTLDGGGVRGVLSARLLQRIAAQYPGFLGEVDLFAGTSTGSILAVGLAMGLSPAELVAFYTDRSKIAFHDTVWDNIRDLGKLAGAGYGTQERWDAIHPVIGDIALGDLEKRVLIATFQLDSDNPVSPAKPGTPRSWKAKFFHNYPGEGSDAGQKAIDVIMRSSAAPTYFPIYQGFIDGGVVANNPSLCALAQAINPETGAQDIRDVVLLSVGTGGKPQYIGSVDGDWGLAQWGITLVELLFDAGIGLADYQCQQLLGDCYLRLNIDLEAPIGLDAVGQVPQLIKIADGVDLTETTRWIDSQWRT